VNWLSIDQVAKHFETSRPTVMAWIESGELKAENHSRSAGGNRRLRVHMSAIEEFSRARSVFVRPQPKQRKRRNERRLVNEFSPSFR
jgi:excisionase family DNA binding protein